MFVLLNIIPSPFPGGADALTYSESLMMSLEIAVFSAGFFFVAVLGHRIAQSTLLRFFVGILLVIPFGVTLDLMFTFLHAGKGVNIFQVGVLLILLAIFSEFVWPISLNRFERH